jgi:hypothetical protein
VRCADVPAVSQQQQIAEVGVGDLEDFSASHRKVVLAAGVDIGDPGRDPVRIGQALDVAAELAGLPGVPGVDFLALRRGLRLGDPVDRHEGAVEDEIRQSVADGLSEDFGQGRGCGSDHVQGFAVPAVGGGAGHPEPGAEPLDISAVPQPGQDEHGLTETGEDPGAPASSHLAALVAQQSGDEPDHGAGQAKADTIGGHVGPFDEAIP